MIAVKNGDVITMEMLVKAGAQRDAVDAKQYTPLMYAAEEGHLECAKRLVG